MPRPAAKRNRLTTRTLGTSKQPQSHETTQDNTGSRDISRSPGSEAMGSSRLTARADPSEVIRQLRNQTPLSKSHELAIGSSPGTEQGATGSRPPTRARGYSSTLSFAGRKGDTSSRIPGTPAFESSILSNFRRRPRQASILHMMQDDEGSSELDDDDFLGGLSPEDESTPLNISRGKSLVLRPAASSPDRSPSLPSTGKSSKRKRLAEAPIEPNSPMDAASSTPASPTPELDIRQRRSTANLQRSVLSPAALSETMVPPMSSPVPDLTHEMSTPDTDRQSSRTKKPRSQKTARPDGSKNLVSTAALQDRLLPRRRHRKLARQGASTFEVLSESDEEDVSPAAADDDELSYLPVRKPSRTRRQPVNKARPVSADMSSPLSSALDTDELDSELELDSEAPVKSYLSEELRLQALKFAEVDQWQMEFEDVINTNAEETGAFR
ncbi:hypothetical protein BDV18DRAFT_136532 [Aspergillus unguis]